jgi:hypothetical protein
VAKKPVPLELSRFFFDGRQLVEEKEIKLIETKRAAYF